MLNRWILVVAVCLALLVSGAGADDDYREARRLVHKDEIQPLETILQTVRRHHSGRVLEVEFEHEDDRYIYEIEMLDEKGVVWELKVDAVSGQLIQSEQED